MGFDKNYWNENYSEPMEMDGIANADRHAAYVKAFFDVEYVDISSIIDFGFGLGFLFNEINKVFKPYRAYGLEPSTYAFDKAKRDIIELPTESTRLKLMNEDILTWVKKSRPRSPRFDLGICTSVFQYLTDEEIRECLPVIANRVKYLYFSVPTDIELERQVSDLGFHDRFAKRRKKEKYLKFLAPHFTIIGNRVLESKKYFSQADTCFTDLLFRLD